MNYSKYTIAYKSVEIFATYVGIYFLKQLKREKKKENKNKNKNKSNTRKQEHPNSGKFILMFPVRTKLTLLK